MHGGAPDRAAITAGFAALVLHTWLYAAFLEDPLVVDPARRGDGARGGRECGRSGDEADTISQNGHRREPVVVARTVP